MEALEGTVPSLLFAVMPHGESILRYFDTINQQKGPAPEGPSTSTQPLNLAGQIRPMLSRWLASVPQSLKAVLKLKLGLGLTLGRDMLRRYGTPSAASIDRYTIAVTLSCVS